MKPATLAVTLAVLIAPASATAGPPRHRHHRAQLGMVAVVRPRTHTRTPTPSKSPAPPPSALAMAQQAAIEFWGSSPCQGNVTVSYSSTEPAGWGTNGVPLPAGWSWSGFATATTPDDQLYTDPPSEYTNCQIVINSSPGQWPDNHTELASFATFCGLIAHEYGHLEGHWDNTTDPPTSITYPVITDANEHIAPCVARYAQAAAAAQA